MEKILSKKKKIGELLVEANLLSSENLLEALRLQKQNGKKLGQILIEHHFIKPADLVSVLGSQLGIPHVWLRKGLVDKKIINSVPYDKARAYQVLPLFKVRNRLTLATADPMAIFILPLH